MDVINEYLKNNYRETEGLLGKAIPMVTPAVVCKDKFMMSVQASSYTYCNPREDKAWPYKNVEIGFPNQKEELIMKYAEDPNDPTETVYAHVPVEIVNKVIEKHGGLENA